MQLSLLTWEPATCVNIKSQNLASNNIAKLNHTEK